MDRAWTCTDDRLKKFHPCQQLRLDRAPDLDQEVIPTLEDFLADGSDNNLSGASYYFANF